MVNLRVCSVVVSFGLLMFLCSIDGGCIIVGVLDLVIGCLLWLWFVLLVVLNGFVVEWYLFVVVL